LDYSSKYQAAFHVHSELEIMVHLICAKPFIYNLAFQDFDLEWHQNPNELEQKIKGANNIFIESILNAYKQIWVKGESEECTGYFHHERPQAYTYKSIVRRSSRMVTSIEETTRKRLSDPIIDFFQDLFNNEIIIPYGLHNGFEISKSYPTIAAINTYCGYFGNPVLQQAYQIRTTDSSELKEYGNIKE
jgi:hypothetical protein